MNETKEFILKTSLKLFLQKSYRDVTMKELVEITGLSKGAFYHYFKSKEELFREIVTHVFSMGVIDYSQLSTTSFYDFIKDYARITVSSLSVLSEFTGEEKGGNPFNIFIIMFEAIKRFPEFLDIEMEMHKKDVEGWKKIISKAKKNGEIRSTSSDEEIAELFLYCLDGLAIRMASVKNPDFLKLNIHRMFETLYEGLEA